MLTDGQITLALTTPILLPHTPFTDGQITLAHITPKLLPHPLLVLMDRQITLTNKVKQQNRGEGHPGGCLESRFSYSIKHHDSWDTVSGSLLCIIHGDLLTRQYIVHFTYICMYEVRVRCWWLTRAVMLVTLHLSLSTSPCLRLSPGSNRPKCGHWMLPSVLLHKLGYTNDN